MQAHRQSGSIEMHARWLGFFYDVGLDRPKEVDVGLDRPEEVDVTNKHSCINCAILMLCRCQWTGLRMMMSLF